MSDNFDDNRTEGPEGYFVQSSTTPRAPRAGATQRERRALAGGRRHQDTELRRARTRLALANAVLGALLAAGLVMVATSKLD